MSFWDTLIGIGAPLLGGIIGGNSGDDAARAHERQLREAMGLIGDAGDEASARMDPWAAQGNWALGQQRNFLTGDMSGFYNSAPYQAGIRTGSDAIHAGATAEHNLWGGGTQADLAAFGHDYAQQYAGQHYNRLAGMSGQGLAAAGTQAEVGMNTANALAGLHSDVGQTQASAYANRGNQWSNALTQMAGYWGQRQGGRG